ncbi:nuclear transport factor 2 family protein [Flavisphingomonas formosensis]|uniref:nuclear transport factor 2 family protein n=1 Tax=Flavisphingomonas formosensis TaxID=861534 RepID=UPI0012FCF8E0|nr:nuclear transport factor 2 family protein [Sphingomonas formosensis]
MAPQDAFDELALSRLVDLYARAIDRLDLVLLRSLYADDAIHDHGAMFRGGPDAFAEFVGASMRSMRTHHFMGNRLFAIAGDMAEGETYAVNSHVIDAGTDRARDYIAGGRYLDRFRRTPEGWRIAHRTRVIDWSQERPHVPGATAAGLPIGGKWPDDASCAMPLLAGIRP